MDTLIHLLLSAPIWLLLAVGGTYALLTRSSHPRVSLLASVALFGFLVLDLVGTLVSQAYFTVVVTPSAIESIAIRAFFVLQAVVHASLLALAITAAAVERPET